MKKTLLGLALSAGLLANSFATTENYTLDPTHSFVEFHISHFGFSNPSGKWMASGTMNLDKDKIEKSSVNISIPVTQVVTGIPKLDEHLQTADFFDTAKYPTATFVSQKVSAIKNGKFMVNGVLTLHGVSKPVTLAVTENKIDVNPITKLQTAGFTASTLIKRSDFGISAYVPHIGDEVKLDIEVEAQLTPAKK